MIRSFTLRDIPLVHRLSEQGIIFHTKSALTQDVRPLREALVHMLVGGQYPTYVWKADDGDAVGFAQLRQGDDEANAHILYLGSAVTADDGAGRFGETEWLSFLEQLIDQAGRRGIYSLIAEVNESGDELPMLRQAGFAVYTRQDIWAAQHSTVTAETEHRSPISLSRAASVDEWDVHLLYGNIVPRLIQLVEPPPTGTDLENIWLLREKDELAAFVHFTDGPAATWLRIFVHPNAHGRGEELVRAALRVIPNREERPIYCCVRRYQSWVQTALQTVGFQHDSSQAMMVRHTVHHARKLTPELSKDVTQKAIAARRNWMLEFPQDGERLNGTRSLDNQQIEKGQTS